MELLNNYDDDRVYQTYYREVGQHALLTPKEERELIQRYHTCPKCHRKFPPKIKVDNCPTCGSMEPPVVTGRSGTCTSCTTKYDLLVVPEFCPRCGSKRDIQARERLAVANLRFVVKRAVKMSKNRPQLLHELISAGNAGLLLAIDRFSPSRQTRFLTYADWWIRKEMYDAINASPLVHIPTHKQKSILREQSEGKYVCIHCGCRVEHHNSTRKLPACIQNKTHDFQIPINDASALLSTPMAIDDCSLCEPTQVDGITIDSNMEDLLREVLKNMTINERDRFILIGYFNVPGKDRQSDPKNLHQLAALTGITPERVRQIKENVLKQLKKDLKKCAIEGVDSICAMN